MVDNIRKDIKLWEKPRDFLKIYFFRKFIFFFYNLKNLRNNY